MILVQNQYFITLYDRTSLSLYPKWYFIRLRTSFRTESSNRSNVLMVDLYCLLYQHMYYIYYVLVVHCTTYMYRKGYQVYKGHNADCAFTYDKQHLNVWPCAYITDLFENYNMVTRWTLSNRFLKKKKKKTTYKLCIIHTSP